jgi:hypothetical protein
VQGLGGALQHVELEALPTSTFQSKGAGVPERNWSAVVIGTITDACEADMKEPASIVPIKDNGPLLRVHSAVEDGVSGEERFGTVVGGLEHTFGAKTSRNVKKIMANASREA